MGTLGDVPDVDIEQLVPMVLDESEVDGMIPLEGTSRVSGNVGHLEFNIGEVKIFHWINLVTLDLDSTIMWVHDGVRVLLLNDDGEVEGETLIPDTIWSEVEDLSLVVEMQEWWVLLVGHAVDVHLWFVIAFWIRKLWKFVLVNITNSECPSGLDIGNEIRVVVVQNFNVKIKFDKLVESRATSQDCSSLTDGSFTARVDVDSTTTVVSGPSTEVWTSFSTVLE